MASAGHHQLVKLYVDGTNGRKVSVHRVHRLLLAGHAVDGCNLSVYGRAHGNQKLVEGVDRLRGLALNRLANLADAHF